MPTETKRPHIVRSFLAPQTEIPLTGEMSRSDKRVTARYEQLEPVTLNMLSATAVASLYRYDKTIHRIVLSATDNSRVTLLRCGVAGERTVQRCRQKQKDRTSCDLFLCLRNGNQTWFLLILSDYRNRKIYNAILLQNRKRLLISA